VESAFSAALSASVNLLALLASLDSVSVALKDFFGNPSYDGSRVILSIELLFKLNLELIDVTH
jgi:hypothetical protein